MGRLIVHSIGRAAARPYKKVVLISRWFHSLSAKLSIDYHFTLLLRATYKLLGFR